MLYVYSRPYVYSFWTRLVNPIPIRGADYTHHTNTGSPRFLDSAASLISHSILKNDMIQQEQVKIGLKKGPKSIMGTHASKRIGNVGENMRKHLPFHGTYFPKFTLMKKRKANVDTL